MYKFATQMKFICNICISLSAQSLSRIVHIAQCCTLLYDPLGETLHLGGTYVYALTRCAFTDHSVKLQTSTCYRKSYNLSSTPIRTRQCHTLATSML